MIDKKILEKIRAHVNRENACGYGAKEVSGSIDADGLIDLLLTPKGIEHCMKYRWPTMEMMLPYKKELEMRNVYINGLHELTNPRLVIAFGGQIHIRSNGFSVCEIYATNDALIKIDATEYSFNSVETHGNSQVFYSEFLNGIVRVFDKSKELK